MGTPGLLGRRAARRLFLDCTGADNSSNRCQSKSPGRRAPRHGIGYAHQECWRNSRSSMVTHEVFNQPPPLVGYNLFSADRALVESVQHNGAAWALDTLSAFGRLVGSEEVIAWGFQ